MGFVERTATFPCVQLSWPLAFAQIICWETGKTHGRDTVSGCSQKVHQFRIQAPTEHRPWPRQSNLPNPMAKEKNYNEQAN